MVTKGEEFTHKHLGTFSSEACKIYVKFHLHIDNKTALVCLLKMGGTRNRHLISINK